MVSVEEKAHGMRQVGIGKASVSEPLMTCRKMQLTSEPGHSSSPGMSLAGARWLARRCPAWRRREPDLRLLRGTWEGWCRYRPSSRRLRRRGAARGSAPGGGNREASSTDAARAGGLARSSAEALVIGVERRGRLIGDLFARTTGSAPGGNE